ncbi:MAG: NupC/NupG family nucleoside CNT transporter [Bacteriovoracaceae bacterium]|nr:NupC/NupG family nucleoside CNT transporter [Bacteriovoracaceae bacterium]
MERFISFIGLLVMVSIAFILSSDRKKVNWKTVGGGILLQIIFGLVILKTNLGFAVFGFAKDFFNGVLGYTNAGTNFVFGPLNNIPKLGFIFAIVVLPTILFMSSLMSILYHIGIMQKVIHATAWVMVKVLGTSGGESLSAAANIFVGQTEAPLVVKPYISKMTKSELMALMTGGMATVAGGVLAAYVGMGVDAGHLLAASVMSAPAALVCAKLMVPETEVSVTAGKVELNLPKTTVNLIDAAASGASDGLKLALNVMAMLLVFIALIAMLNGILGWIGGWFGYPLLSLEIITGYIFYPVAWIIGVPSQDAYTVGTLLGKKLIINEFVAYMDLQKHMATLSPRATVISTYALCGFANFSSIAIQLGGIGSLAPDRRKDLAQLGVKCLIGGTLACLMTACIAGMFI